MAPSPSPEPLGLHELDRLVDLADDTLVAALTDRPSASPRLRALPAVLHRRRGAFVTLTVDGQLNGCIGDVAGRQPLASSVPRLALAAAFDDPRLPALRVEEYRHLTIEVSVLSEPDPIDASDRAELVAGLRPGVDGVIIGAGERTGLFLPDVWSQLPGADDFLDHLWRKAGLPASVWPDTIMRFTTQRRSRRTDGSDEAPPDRRLDAPGPARPR
jgi:AmmeMemoRadiSam system protein A